MNYKAFLDEKTIITILKCIPLPKDAQRLILEALIIQRVQNAYWWFELINNEQWWYDWLDIDTDDH